MTLKKSLPLVPLFALSLSSLALAHPGHDPLGLSGGILHPLTGLDHLLAILGVGLFASQQASTKAKLLLPAAFLASMLAGGIATFAGLHLPAVEALTAASVLVLGLLLSSAARLPLTLSCALTAIFALAHGAAHASELTAGSSPAAFAAGFLLTTSALLATGLLTGILAQRLQAPRFVRIAGALTAALSLLCFLQM